MLFQKSTPRAAPAPPPPPPPPVAEMRPCSEAGCGSLQGRSCAYVDRRQRACPSAWCADHEQPAFGQPYCRRHAGVIRALGEDFGNVALPDLDNRAPGLANWVGRDLDQPIRLLIDGYFPHRRLNVAPVSASGTARERVWGRSWKLISEKGIDLSVAVSVTEAEDHVVRVFCDGRVLLELTPPWIEARRHGVAIDEDTDKRGRAQFYALILEDVEAAILDARRRDPLRLASAR